MTCSFVKFGCSIGIFLNTAHLICRSTDISKCFRWSLRLRDNESRLYLLPFSRGVTLKGKTLPLLGLILSFQSKSQFGRDMSQLGKQTGSHESYSPQ